MVTVSALLRRFRYRYSTHAYSVALLALLSGELSLASSFNFQGKVAIYDEKGLQKKQCGSRHVIKIVADPRDITVRDMSPELSANCVWVTQATYQSGVDSTSLSFRLVPKDDSLVYFNDRASDSHIVEISGRGIKDSIEVTKMHVMTRAQAAADAADLARSAKTSSDAEKWFNASIAYQSRPETLADRGNWRRSVGRHEDCSSDFKSAADSVGINDKRYSIWLFDAAFCANKARVEAGVSQENADKHLADIVKLCMSGLPVPTNEQPPNFRRLCLDAILWSAQSSDFAVVANSVLGPDTSDDDLTRNMVELLERLMGKNYSDLPAEERVNVASKDIGRLDRSLSFRRKKRDTTASI